MCGPFALQRVADGPLHVQVEGVAELVRLVVVHALAGAAELRDLVVAQAVLLELRVDLTERLLADHAGAARRQLPGVALAPDVAGLLEDVEQLLQFVDGVDRVVAQQVPQLVEVDGIEVPVVLRPLQLALEAVDLLHLGT